VALQEGFLGNHRGTIAPSGVGWTLTIIDTLKRLASAKKGLPRRTNFGVKVLERFT